MLKHKKPDIN